MATDWSEQLQIALYERLSTYSTLTSIASVVDDVTESKPSYPYVTIGDAVLSENSTDTNIGMVALQTIHVWSREPGRKQVKNIQGIIAGALARYDLTISGFTLITCEIESENSFLDTDGVTRHGVSTFSIQFE